MTKKNILFDDCDLYHKAEKYFFSSQYNYKTVFFLFYHTKEVYNC